MAGTISAAAPADCPPVPRHKLDGMRVRAPRLGGFPTLISPGEHPPSQAGVVSGAAAGDAILVPVQTAPAPAAPVEVCTYVTIGGGSISWGVFGGLSSYRSNKTA